MRFLLILIFMIFGHYLLVHRASASDGDVLSRRGSISFENADITVSIKTPNGEKIAEAFNATNDVKDARKMRWVSLGLPRLLTNNNRTDTSQVSTIRLYSYSTN